MEDETLKYQKSGQRVVSLVPRDRSDVCQTDSPNITCLFTRLLRQPGPEILHTKVFFCSSSIADHQLCPSLGWGNERSAPSHTVYVYAHRYVASHHVNTLRGGVGDNNDIIRLFLPNTPRCVFLCDMNVPLNNSPRCLVSLHPPPQGGASQT